MVQLPRAQSAAGILIREEFGDQHLVSFPGMACEILLDLVLLAASLFQKDSLVMLG